MSINAVSNQLSLAPPRVILSIDRKLASMRRGKWILKVRTATLPDWLQLYRGLAERRNDVYQPWVDVIEAALRKAEIPIPPKVDTRQKGRRK